MFSGRMVRTRRLPRLVMGCAIMLPVAAGCRTVNRAVGKGTGEAKTLLGDIEPTGVVAETQKREALWAAARQKVEAIDVDGFNRAVGDLAAAIQRTTERLDALKVADVSGAGEDLAASASILRRQLEQSKFDESIRSIGTATESIRTKIEQIDVEGINGLTKELRDVATGLQSQVRGVGDDLQKLAQSAADRVDAVSPAYLRETLEHVDRAVAEIDRTASRLPATAEKLESTVEAARYAFRVIFVAGLLAIACLGMRLVQLVRRRQDS